MTLWLRQNGIAKEGLCIYINDFDVECNEFTPPPFATRFCRSHQVGHDGPAEYHHSSFLVNDFPVVVFCCVWVVIARVRQRSRGIM